MNYSNFEHIVKRVTSIVHNLRIILVNSSFVLDFSIFRLSFLLLQR